MGRVQALLKRDARAQADIAAGERCIILQLAGLAPRDHVENIVGGDAQYHARAVIDRVLAQGTPLRSVRYVSVRQSMSNGGGPACLRLRVVLTDAELVRVKPGVLLTDARYESLTAWVRRHYRDRLTADDLADLKLLDESRAALDELTELLGLGAVYAFQGPADLRSRRYSSTPVPTSRSTP